MNKLKEIDIPDRLIISIDVSKKQDLISLCQRISGQVTTLKLGLELIYSCGIDVVKITKSFGYRVMLDAKLHDIPNTVSKSIAAITRLGVDKITIHTSGGTQMLMDAKKSMNLEAERMKIIPPLLFGVTILTSLNDDDLKKIGFNKNYIDTVLYLSEIAAGCEIDGLVCSPKEVMSIREKFSDDLLIATPGIRLKDDANDDQKRVSTPYDAIKNGADFLVAGRSVTSNKNPVEIIKRILDDIERALG